MKKRSGDSELLAAKQHVIDVAKELHAKGYLPRTWGNVSCRIDKEVFLITPSGIRYEDMTPDMICLVNMKNLSYKGEFTPSYERGVHAACYRTRKDVEFVVITHQVFASCAGVLGLKRIYTYVEDEDVVIPCIPYGFPGSTKLAGNVVTSLKKNRDSDSFILSNHGALFVGANAEDVIENIERTEDACDNFLMDVCKTDMYHGVEEGFGSHLEGDEIIYDIEDTPERVKHIHREIYDRRPDVKYIVHNKSDAVMTVSRTATHLRPLLFDFAELVGYSVKIPSNEHGKDGHSYHNIKKNSNAVFALNDGAYCIGETLEDAVAASIVLDKGCIAYLAALRHGEGHPISYLDCIKMNKYYKKTYSRISSEYLEQDDDEEYEPVDVKRRTVKNDSRKALREEVDEEPVRSARKEVKKEVRKEVRKETRREYIEDEEDEIVTRKSSGRKFVEEPRKKSVKRYEEEFDDDDFEDEFEDDFHDDFHDDFEEDDDYTDAYDDEFEDADVYEDEYADDYKDDYADDLREDFEEEFIEEFGEDFRNYSRKKSGKKNNFRRR